MNAFENSLSTAVIGVDTLWGGDVFSASGLDRMIADSWFSDLAPPEAYTCTEAQLLRTTGGVMTGDTALVDQYLHAVNIRDAIRGIVQEAAQADHFRSKYLERLAKALQTMFDIAMEVVGAGPTVPFEVAVEAATGATVLRSDPAEKLHRLEELLRRAGYQCNGPSHLSESVERWRMQRCMPMSSVASLSAAFIALYDKLSGLSITSHLPSPFLEVPRANITFVALPDARFSGSMNYLGRDRRPDGTPAYEAVYEINQSLRLSVSEFEQLITHEVVPGHVTTFAYLQNLFVRGQVGFEATVLTMNTPSSTLFEGIANNAILIAHGVTDVKELPNDDLQIGLLLALLEDDAKNDASYLTWYEKWPRDEVVGNLQSQYLLTRERAAKIGDSWARHPLLGQMSLPTYRVGSDRVAQLRQAYPADRVIPAIYGAKGIADIVSIEEVINS